MNILSLTVSIERLRKEAQLSLIWLSLGAVFAEVVGTEIVGSVEILVFQSKVQSTGFHLDIVQVFFIEFEVRYNHYINSSRMLAKFSSTLELHELNRCTCGATSRFSPFIDWVGTRLLRLEFIGMSPATSL